MTYLTSYLPFPPSSSSSSSSSAVAGALPPPSSHLIISDTSTSPSDFAVYDLVSAAISRKQKVVWVDFRNEGRSSWETVLKKLGTPLPPPTSPLFAHITPTSFPSSFSSKSTTSPNLFTSTNLPSLRDTFDTVKSVESEESVVILDGLCELLWMGFGGVEVGSFVRAVFGFTRRTKSILVTTLHADHLHTLNSSSVETDLLERLIRIGGGGWWSISGLSSGRSGDVMGEITSHPLFPPHTTGEIAAFPSIPRDAPLQYRLESNTVKLFPKGTGRGFL